ncbi:MAG: hypothetical protein ACKVOW_12425 [Chitinophagaceae bacterium]
MRTISFVVSLFTTVSLSAQQKAYYYQIPDTPTTYTATTVAARMIDGLGFRYFWATEGLTAKDLQFSPSKDARTCLETIEHIDGLVQLLLNAVNKRSANFGSNSNEKLSFAQLREKTLRNIQAASEILKLPGTMLEEFTMGVESSNGKTIYPFWNIINGPVEDAIWHVGQVVLLRRSSGNPLPKGVNFLIGNKTE